MWEEVKYERYGMISNAKKPQKPYFNERHFKKCLHSLKNKSDFKCYEDLYNAFEDVNRRIGNRKVSKDFSEDYPDKWDKCIDFDCYIGLVENFTEDMYYVDREYP